MVQLGIICDHKQGPKAAVIACFAKLKYCSRSVAAPQSMSYTNIVHIKQTQLPKPRLVHVKRSKTLNSPAAAMSMCSGKHNRNYSTQLRALVTRQPCTHGAWCPSTWPTLCQRTLATTSRVAGEVASGGWSFSWQPNSQQKRSKKNGRLHTHSVPASQVVHPHMPHVSGTG